MIRDLITKQPGSVGFGVVGVTWLIAFVAWVQSTPSALTGPSAYDFFPLVGLMAFGALWSTYVVNASSTYLKAKGESLRRFYKVTGYAIVALILAHPTILITRLWLDGFGLPPGSYAAYVSQSSIWVVYLGVTSLVIFLSFELRRWFSRKDWWQWIVYVNDIAMLLIFYHGMTLGGELQRGWFRYIWWLYGIALIVAIVYLRFVVKRNSRPVIRGE